MDQMIKPLSIVINWGWVITQKYANMRGVGLVIFKLG